MKTFVESWKTLHKDISDAINHSITEGLPLSSIELTPKEWDDFVIARTTLANGTRLDASEFDCGTAIFMGTKIYKGEK